MVRRIVFGAAGVLLLAALVGFFSVRFAWNRLHVHESDVFGVYVAHYLNGTETVKLNRDHTYSQEIESEFSTEPVRNAGAWSWHTDDGPEVVMDGCITPADFSGHLPIDFATHHGWCHYPVEYWVAFVFKPLVLFSSEEHPLKKQ